MWRRVGFALVLAGCIQEPATPIEPPPSTTARDGGFAPLPVEPPPELHESLLFRAVALVNRFESTRLDDAGLHPPMLVMPERPPQGSGFDGHLTLSAITPNGRRGLMVVNGSEGVVVHVLDLTRFNETTEPIWSSEIFGGLPLVAIDDDWIVIRDVDGFSILPLDGSTPARLLASNDARDFLFTDRHLVFVEFGSIWIRSLDGLGTVQWVEPASGGFIRMYEARESGLVLFEAGGIIFRLWTFDPDPVAVTSTADCGAYMGADDAQVVCLPLNGDRVVTFALDGSDFMTEGQLVAELPSRVQNRFVASSRERIWTQHQDRIIVTTLNGPGRGTSVVIEGDDRLNAIDTTASVAVLSRNEFGTQHHKVVSAEGRVLHETAEANMVWIDRSGRWFLYRRANDAAIWAHDLVEGTDHFVAVAGSNVFPTPYGILTAFQGSVSRFIRMNDWGVAEEILPWGTFVRHTTIGPSAVVEDRGNAGVWRIPFADEPPVKIANLSAREQVVTLTPEHLIVAEWSFTMTTTVAVYSTAVLEPQPPLRRFEVPSVQIVAADRHMFTIGTTTVSITNLDTGVTRDAYGSEKRIFVAQWHPGTKQLVVLHRDDSLDVVLVPLDGPPRVRVEGWEAGTFSELLLPKAGPLAVFRRPAAVLDLTNDDPPRLAPLDEAEVRGDLLPEAAYLLIRTLAGHFLWRTADDEITPISSSLMSRTTLMPDRERQRFLLPVANGGFVFDIRDETITELESDILPLAWTGDGTSILHQRTGDARVSLYEVDRGESRVITTDDAGITSATSIRASIPVVTSHANGDSAYYGVGRNGRLVPLTPVDDADELLITPLP